MKRRSFTIECHDNLCIKIAGILQHYVQTAYPPGGSNCASTTRTALLDIAGKLATEEENVVIGSRQRPMILAAIKWYFSEVERFSPDLREVLLNHLSLKK